MYVYKESFFTWGSSGSFLFLGSFIVPSISLGTLFLIPLFELQLTLFPRLLLGRSISLLSLLNVSRSLIVLLPDHRPLNNLRR